MSWNNKYKRTCMNPECGKEFESKCYKTKCCSQNCYNRFLKGPTPKKVYKEDRDREAELGISREHHKVMESNELVYAEQLGANIDPWF